MTRRTGLTFDVAQLPPATRALREGVRRFLDDELSRGGFVPRCDGWLAGWDPAFSRRLGEHGWLGLTMPVRLGGHGGTPLDRFVVTEELLAAGAPVAAHWFADRQTAPSLLRHGSPDQQKRYLPAIARGECFVAIGMSEPDSGSDLASVRTRATRTTGGWRLTGEKIWTSGAHRAHLLVVLARTSPPGADRHAGLTQFLVELPAAGVEVRPIRLLTGEHHFNSVVLDEVLVPDDMVLGPVDGGWGQVTGELAFERSGPERFLSTFPLLVSLVGELAATATDRHDEITLGTLVSRLWTLRQMSIAVAFALTSGSAPTVEGALVKDLGTRFEHEVVDAARLLSGTEPDPDHDGALPRLLAQAILHSPGFTLRGGTTEILQGIIANALGLR
jgi:alkylation response protein AidB-like acyl-CoA dehydrogenase